MTKKGKIRVTVINDTSISSIETKITLKLNEANVEKYDTLTLIISFIFVI